MGVLFPSSLKLYTQLATSVLVFVLRAAAGQLPHGVTVEHSQQHRDVAHQVFMALLAEAHPADAGDNPVLNTSQWDLLIQRFVFSLYSQKREPKEHTRWFSPVITYLVFASVTASGDFRRAFEITQIFAKLVYLGRSAIINECKALEQTPMGAHECVELAT